jgi:hypothetical protein
MPKNHKKDCKCAFCPGRTVWQDPDFRKKHKESMQRAAINVSIVITELKEV